MNAATGAFSPLFQAQRNEAARMLALYVELLGNAEIELEGPSQ